MNSYHNLLNAAREFLKEHGVADADLDAWYLLSHVTGMNRADFFMHKEKPCPDQEATIFKELIGKRARRIPLQHLTGSQEFMGMEFIVSGDVLVPRQDTECLVEEVLNYCNDKTVLDLCTGSGCIIISLAKLGNLKRAAGSDLSDKALTIAGRNAKRHGVEIEFYQSDLFYGMEGTFDIIVSNPPYIRTAVIDTLKPEVRDHEPVMALDAGPDGLMFYRRIAAGLKYHLTKGGYVFFEIGYDQGEEVKNILAQEGITDIRVRKDLAGLDRIVSGRRP